MTTAEVEKRVVTSDFAPDGRRWRRHSLTREKSSSPPSALTWPWQPPKGTKAKSRMCGLPQPTSDRRAAGRTGGPRNGLAHKRDCRKVTKPFSPESTGGGGACESHPPAS